MIHGANDVLHVVVSQEFPTSYGGAKRGHSLYIYDNSLLANRVQCGNKAQRVVWLSGTGAMHVVGCTAHGARWGCTLRGCAGRMCILMRIHNVKALTDARFRTIACKY